MVWIFVGGWYGWYNLGPVMSLETVLNVVIVICPWSVLDTYPARDGIFRQGKTCHIAGLTGNDLKIGRSRKPWPTIFRNSLRLGTVLVDTWDRWIVHYVSDRDYGTSCTIRNFPTTYWAVPIYDDTSCKRLLFQLLIWWS